jgi:hypothetical protein
MNSTINLAQNNEVCFRCWCSDFDQWPQSWAGDEDDIVVGQKLLVEFKEYLLGLIVKGRKKKTVKKHADYLWSLGGEIISDTNTNGVDANLSGTDILLNYISPSGGPYWRHAYGEKEHEQFDSICRLLYQHISKKQS